MITRRVFLRITALAVLIPFLFVASAQAVIRPYIIWGQSNAEGRGLRSELPPELQALPPNVQIVQTELTDQDDQWFGVEVSLGAELAAAYPEDEILLIKYTRGSTFILDWWWNKTLYQDALAFTLAGLEGIQPLGFIWIQGESDSTLLDNAERYPARLKAFLHRFRTDIGNSMLTAYIVMVNGAGTFSWLVQQGQAGISSGINRPVSSYQIPHQESQPAHLTSVGYLELGRRIAEVIINQ